ncbi:hypothetical protein [Campylobacter sp. RM16187]|uniref:hypothetical protein n=1 Tax=Campylobacter sp. RM16187 TaxID=1660063 RepID=UPI0021B4E48F|nr:hypothetical protein [Campylobacter sp. RM16187]QKG28779.1 hypothetical protein CDOMF_0497 [Campylobacter sp. RM16187]
MLKLQVRSDKTKEQYGFKFVDVTRIDYQTEEVAFISGYNGNRPISTVQFGFENTEFRLVNQDTKN